MSQVRVQPLVPEINRKRCSPNSCRCAPCRYIWQHSNVLPDSPDDVTVLPYGTLPRRQTGTLVEDYRFSSRRAGELARKKWREKLGRQDEVNGKVWNEKWKTEMENRKLVSRVLG